MITQLIKIIQQMPHKAGQNIKKAKGINELNLKTQWQLLKK
jgi:hypothetical protein